MGRKKKERKCVYDRMGNEIDPGKLPECPEHKDCFACLDGKCTALNTGGGKNCVFYKPAEKALSECRDAFRKLKEQGRYDIIGKYFKIYEAMGLLDEEIEEENRQGLRQAPYNDVDLGSLMAQVPRFS